MDASRTERMSVKEMVNGGYSEFYDAMGFKDNPSLDFSAKAYIALLTRDLDVKKNGPTDVGMRDAGLEEKIRKLVYRGGEKREFAEVVEELNKSNGPKSNVVVVPVFDPEDKINAHPLGITISGMTAKFVERVIILTRDSNWAIEKQGGELLTRFPDHSESLKLKERSLVDS